jgi:hypothetical protein
MKKFAAILTLLTVSFFIQTDVRAQGAAIEIESPAPPPALPVYVQPQCPRDGYLWSPGYWAYAPKGYYWVPGVWVNPPHTGLLWTPGYWSLTGANYGWHAGYWGPHVGYYGGISYGFGYSGAGYYGGRWEGGSFQYNTYVSSVNVSAVHSTYSNNIGVNNTVVNHSAYNGGGGVSTAPNAVENSAKEEQHIAPTAEQQSHQAAASQDKKQFAYYNKGKPATTAMNTTDGQRFNKDGKAGKEPQKAEDKPAAHSSSKSSSRIKHTSFKSSSKVSIGKVPKTHTSSSSGRASSKSKKY